MRTSVFIYLAVGCTFLGMLITYATVLLAAYLRLDVSNNLWIMAVPLVIAVGTNILLLELISRRKKK